MFLFLPHGLTSHELCASAVLGWKSLGLAHSTELYKCTDSNHVFWSMEIVGEAGTDRLKLKLKIWSDVTFLFSEMLLAWQSWGIVGLTIPVLVEEMSENKGTKLFNF